MNIKLGGQVGDPEIVRENFNKIKEAFRSISGVNTQNIDGGSPSSIYLSIQNIEGGEPSSIFLPSQNFNGGQP